MFAKTSVRAFRCAALQYLAQIHFIASMEGFQLSRRAEQSPDYDGSLLTMAWINKLL